MTHNLFLTKIEKKNYKEKNKIFLSNSCIAHEVNKDNLGNFDIIPFHWNDKDKVNKDHKYLYNFYYKILENLKDDLNQIHGLNQTTRYWHIIIGTWLYKFLINSYDKWESVKYAFNIYKISNIYNYDLKYDELISSDCSEFNYISNSNLWFNFLISEIIKFQIKTDVKQTKIKTNNIFDNKDYKINKYTQQSSFFLNAYDKLVSKIQTSPELVLYQTYFRKKNNFKLFVKTFTLPRVYSVFEKKFELNQPNNRDKLILSTKDTNSDYENFIKSNIFKFLPISYLEGFIKIKKFVNNINLNPKLIISAVGERNDLFQIWAAEKLSNNTKYFCSEHGGNIEDQPKFDNKIKKYDCFLSWNKSEKKNVCQITPQFYSKKINHKELNKGKYLTIIISTPSLFNNAINFDIRGDQTLEAHEALKALKRLPEKIYEKLRFRPHVNSHLWCITERIVNDFGSQCLTKNKKIDDDFLNSKILVNTDFQTSFYESMYSNKPVIIFNKRQLTNEINPKIRKLIEKFTEENIVINNEETLIKHLSNIWHNPNKWWNGDKVKILRSEFNSICSKNSKMDFSEEILLIKKRYEEKYAN